MLFLTPRNSRHTFPEDMEYAFMDLLAPEMTLERYLAMPEQERKKWWINCDTQPAAPTGFTDPENGEEIYATHYYFEPASPEILDPNYQYEKSKTTRTSYCLS